MLIAWRSLYNPRVPGTLIATLKVRWILSKRNHDGSRDNFTKEALSVLASILPYPRSRIVARPGVRVNNSSPFRARVEAVRRPGITPWMRLSIRVFSASRHCVSVPEITGRASQLRFERAEQMDEHAPPNLVHV
jgi:hypothetical protein